MDLEESGTDFLSIVLIISALVIFAILGGIFWVTASIEAKVPVLTGMGSILMFFLIWLQFKNQTKQIEIMRKGIEPEIKVTSHFSLITSGDEVSKPLISLTVSNIGTVPVTLVSCGISLEGGKNLTFLNSIDGFPLVLEAGKSHKVYREVEKLKQSLAGKKPEYIWFRDATGREFNSKWYIKI